VVGKTPGPPDG